MNLFFQLLYNLGILISISIISGFVGYQDCKDWKRILAQGIIFGSASIIGMLHPVIIAPGLIFDGRSIMISLCGLFFGPVATCIASTMAFILRIYQGGVGVRMGVLVIITSACIGAIFHIRNKKKKREVTRKLIYCMSIIVHVVMLLIMFTLPDGIGVSTIKLIGLPILITYPIAALLIGRVLLETNERIKMVATLKETENQLSRALDNAPIPIMLRTDDGKVLKISKKWTEITGYTIEDIPTITDWTKKAYGEKNEEMERKIIDSYDHNNPKVEGEYKIITADDRVRIWQVNMANIGEIKDGRKLAMMAAIDITERKAEEEALKNSKEKYRLITEYTSDVIWVLNLTNSKFLFISPSVYHLRGITAEEAMNETLEQALVPDSFDMVKNALEKHKIDFIKQPDIHNYYIHEIQQPCKNGKIIWVEISVRYRFNAEGEIELIGVSRNIEERKKIEKEILYLSYCDQLTGLYNRRFYEEELNRIDKKENLPLSIIMGDVNQLKLINDSFGHVMGDELLKRVAEILRKACSPEDMIARLGGDEFVILLPRTDAIKTDEIIKRINDLSLNEKVGLINISISLGKETKENEKEDIRDVFKKAEDNMYKKKLFNSAKVNSKTINTIISTLHEKNRREELHSHRVSELCECMGVALGLPEYDIMELKTVGLLHDIGKIAIEENILNKPGKLSESEWKEIRRHPEIGYRILSTVNDMSDLAEYILAHHERWDGQGYPRGLREKEIPVQSRIISIIDSYDAMTSDRSYRSALPEEIALKELKKGAGTQFDPTLLNVFIEKVLGKG